MTPTIRPAVPKDEAAVVALWRACDLVASTNDPAAISGSPRPAPARTCWSRKTRAAASAAASWSAMVAALPDARGCGIGRRMVQAAEDWLRPRGAVKAQLLVRETNTRVVSSYEHLGFETAPRTVMAKWLVPT